MNDYECQRCGAECPKCMPPTSLPGDVDSLTAQLQAAEEKHEADSAMLAACANVCDRLTKERDDARAQLAVAVEALAVIAGPDPGSSWRRLRVAEVALARIKKGGA